MSSAADIVIRPIRVEDAEALWTMDSYKKRSQPCYAMKKYHGHVILSEAKDDMSVMIFSWCEH